MLSLPPLTDGESDAEDMDDAQRRSNWITEIEVDVKRTYVVDRGYDLWKNRTPRCTLLGGGGGSGGGSRQSSGTWVGLEKRQSSVTASVSAAGDVGDTEDAGTSEPRGIYDA